MNNYENNISKVEMTDKTSYVIGRGKYPKLNMKENHVVKQSIHGFEYIVNLCNKRAYKAI